MVEVPACFYRVSIKALILNESKDKFLICRERIGYWGLPGGGLEWGTTPQEDLAREIREEMGLKVVNVAETPSYFFTEQQVVNPAIKIANVVYECTLESLDFTPSDECLQIAFVDAVDIHALQVFDGVAALARMFTPERHKRISA